MRYPHSLLSLILKSRPQAVALLSSLCLLLVPTLSPAQTTDDPAAIPREKPASFMSTNVAEAALERSVRQAVTTDFSSWSSGDRVLIAQQGNSQNQTQPSTPSPAPPSLGDLGISPDQAQGNAQDQARLDRRSHMLKMHQRYGLITLGAMAATIAVSGLAGGKNNTATGRDIHGALGSVTADMYFMAAYYAIRAPRIPGTPVRGPIRLHKALAWVHGPGMILTPILGAMALAQEQNGEKVHGIAKAHSAVAAVTYTSFGLAFLSVAIKF